MPFMRRIKPVVKMFTRTRAIYIYNIIIDYKGAKIPHTIRSIYITI
jgi:hypothetical protein